MRRAARDMSTVRRLGKDESGMTLGLTMVMIVLIGVMGAGLLTFVSTDLGTVIEVNRGQRAFEVADAGIGVAQRQLDEHCGSGDNCIDYYDDFGGGIGTPDNQWSVAEGGVTLYDLDGDEDPEDNVHVTIDYRYSPIDQRGFKVVATGNYRGTKRKIEAIFMGISDEVGGSGIGHPTYYTPSNIKIEGDLTLSGVSLFTEQNILIPNLSTVADFRAYNRNDSTLHFPSPKDNLDNWDSRDFPNGNDGYWNTQKRLDYPRIQGQDRLVYDDYIDPGFAALGKICGYTDISTNTCAPDAASVADGVYGYDSTTGERISSTYGACPTSTDPLNTTKPLADRGNNWTFCEKPEEDIANEELNASGTISFPFPRPVPNAQLLRGYATETGRYWEGAPTQAKWNEFFPNAANDNKMVFIDAQGNDINFNPTGDTRNNKGILVVWCGNLTMHAQFQGVVLSLWPDGKTGSELPGGSTCTNDLLSPEGTYRNNARTMSGWVYAGGGNESRAGVELASGSRMEDFPNANSWSFFNDAFTGGPPTGVQSKGWRELYEDE